ncbi:hypothetical protein SBRCBS47491_004918 [Sporothrix bragantina]|uniref:Uncharacterized protein n=1 Tax=Sporothrix bragantina TaxID=671064 RepID=A0ABP0BT55_9PEZI
MSGGDPFQDPPEEEMFSPAFGVYQFSDLQGYSPSQAPRTVQVSAPQAPVAQPAINPAMNRTNPFYESMCARAEREASSAGQSAKQQQPKFELSRDAVRSHHTTCGIYYGPHVDKGHGGKSCCSRHAPHICCPRRPEHNTIEFESQRARIVNTMNYLMPTQEARSHLAKSFCYTACLNTHSCSTVRSDDQRTPLTSQITDTGMWGMKQLGKFIPEILGMQTSPDRGSETCGETRPRSTSNSTSTDTRSDVSTTATLGNDDVREHGRHKFRADQKHIFRRRPVQQEPSGPRRGGGVNVSNDISLTIEVDKTGWRPLPSQDEVTNILSKPYKADETAKKADTGKTAIRNDENEWRTVPLKSNITRIMSTSYRADQTAKKTHTGNEDSVKRFKTDSSEEPIKDSNKESNKESSKDSNTKADSKAADKGKAVDKSKACSIIDTTQNFHDIPLSSPPSAKLRDSVEHLVAREYDMLEDFCRPDDENFDVDSHGSQESGAKDADGEKKEGPLSRFAGRFFRRSV